MDRGIGIVGGRPPALRMSLGLRVCLGHLSFSLLFPRGAICYHPLVPAASNHRFHRHCEDCFVALLLAMTAEVTACRTVSAASYSSQSTTKREEMPRILMTGAAGGIGTS